MKTRISTILIAALLGVVCSATLNAQGTAFTYQGRLLTTNGPATGLYDLRFVLYDALVSGSQMGPTLTNNAVVVSNGLFAVTLDFGNQFPGADRWLEIGVRTNNPASPTSFVSLTPRQKLTPTPYAVTAANVVSGGLPATYSSVVTFNNVSNSFRGVFAGDGSGLNNVNATALGGVSADGFWKTTGNAGTSAGENFLGTTDDQPLELRSYNQNGLRLHYVSQSSGSPLYFSDYGINLIGGYWGNTVSNTVVGATIAGGGDSTSFAFGSSSEYPNVVTADFGSIGGGYANTAGYAGTVPGGYENKATGQGSFAAGRYAQATNNGAFVWSDGSQSSFTSTGDDCFDVLASEGITFFTGTQLDVRDTNSLAGTIRVGANAFGGDPKLVKFGDQDYVHVGENIRDDHMELKAADFSFVHGDGSGYVGINTSNPQQELEVNGRFMEVDGLGNERAYLGGDGAGGDVQVGSLNTNVTAVAFYNAGNSSYMHIFCSSITIEGGADLAEPFHISHANKTVPKGSVVVIDGKHPGQLKISDRPYDPCVAGVVSGANGVNPGIQLKQKGRLEGGQNVALTGRVYVRAEASNGAIHPGDMLTTSSCPGLAMKVTNHARAVGAILGKAMTGLKSGKGMVLVLVTLQ